jgi:hypothetical protein
MEYSAQGCERGVVSVTPSWFATAGDDGAIESCSRVVPSLGTVFPWIFNSQQTNTIKNVVKAEPKNNNE